MNRSFGGSLDCNSVNYNKGKSFRFSEWNSSTLYSNDDYIQDFVSYMGSMYACIQTNTAVEPTNELYWKLVVSGQPGIQGKQGNTGVTFTPHVDIDGNLSWTNDGGLENPQTVNIKGPKGADSTVPGPKGDKGDDGIGLMGPQGRTGEMGIGLEFNWDGTKLGIKRTVDDEYTYVDLKGTTGARGLKGNTGNTGPEGPQGPKGDSLYIQVSEPNEFGQRFLQKRYSESEAWVSFFDLSQMKGPKGDSIIVERNIETGNIEYRYQNQPSSANKILIYKDDIKGPKGDTIAKTYVADDGYLYIQLSGEDLPRRVGYVRGDRGADGREIVLRVYSGPSEDPNDPRIGTHLQWKYAGDEYKLWTNLIQINDLMNVALAGLKLEYNTVSETDETGITTKYEVIELSHYQVEFDENNNLVLTEKIANLSSVKVPTKTLLKDIKYDYDNNKLIFVFDTATGDETIEIDCDPFIRQGNGITISDGNIINVDVADESEKLADESDILVVDELGLRVRGIKDKLIKEFNLIKNDRDNNTHYYSYEYIAQDGTVYPIEIPDFVEWNNNIDQTRQIELRNNDKLVGLDVDTIIRNLIHLDGTDTVQVGDSKVSINLNGKESNPTYNQQALALISNLEDEIAGLHLVKEDAPTDPDIAARYYLADKDGELLGDVHIDILKDNYLKEVTYNEDTYTFIFDFWVNDDPEEPAHDKIVTITLQKLFDNLKAIIDEVDSRLSKEIDDLEAKHIEDVKSLNETIAIVNTNLVNSINILNQNMADGFNTINGGINNEIRPAIEKNSEDISKLREDLTTEISNRENADNQLQSNIDAEVDRASKAEEMLQANINLEVNRALQAEKLLQDNINTEVVRATNAEQTIQTNLDNEISRSEQKDQELTNKTDKTNQDLIDTNNNLSAEILRATNAESKIYDHIHEVEAKIDGKIDETEKGQPNGVATLDENGFIPSTQINGQMARVFGVDGVATASTLPTLTNLDVGKIYWTTDTKEFYNWNGLSWDDPMAPKDDTIYNFRNSDATGDTSRTNILYRWDGENLTEISESLALGEVTGTAYEGNKGAANRAAINSLPNTILTSLNISANNTGVDINLTSVNKSGLNYGMENQTIKTIPLATTENAGLLSPEDKGKLNNTFKTINEESIIGIGNIETVGKKTEEGGEVFNNSTVAGSNSHAEGTDTSASGSNAHSEGAATIASGNGSHAEGYMSKAAGNNSHAEGYETSALNEQSHAEGLQTTSSGLNAHAEGYQTTASGDFSHSEGQNSEASGQSSHVEGNSTKAEASHSHAEGNKTTARGSQSHAEGASSNIAPEGTNVETLKSSWDSNKFNIALGTASHTEGLNNISGGNSSHAEGEINYVTGIASHVEGYSNIVTGSYGAHAEGQSNTVSGQASHAEGNGNIASGAYSHAEGRGTQALNTVEHAEGRWNKSNTNTISSIGIGTDDENRKNAIEVTNSGDVYVLNIGEYDGTNVDSASTVQNIISSLASKDEVNTKQDTLVSGTNIKTINGASLLGSGNITIETPEGITDVLDNKIYARTQGSWVDLTDWLTWAEYD